MLDSFNMSVLWCFFFSFLAARWRHTCSGSSGRHQLQYSDKAPELQSLQLAKARWDGLHRSGNGYGKKYSRSGKSMGFFFIGKQCKLKWCNTVESIPLKADLGGKDGFYRGFYTWLLSDFFHLLAQGNFRFLRDKQGKVMDDVYENHVLAAN